MSVYNKDVIQWAAIKVSMMPKPTDVHCDNNNDNNDVVLEATT